MSESKSKLEQVLEFLLAEDNERAEELLHEYVVETARKEYERILDDAEETPVAESTEEESDEETVEEAEESEEEAVEEAEESEEEAVEEEIDQADPEADFVSDVEEADEDIEADEINVNELLGIDNSTMCNQTSFDPFINVIFIDEDKLFICLF